MNVSLTVANYGGAAAAPFRVGAYLSTSASSLSNPTPFTYCDFAALAPGATSSCSGQVTLPSAIQLGRFYFIAVADIANQLVEYYQAQSVRLSDSGLVTILSGCSYSLSSTSAQFTASGGTGSFVVQAQPECSWSAAPNVNWTTVSSRATGTGSAQVSFVVAPNPGAARTGSINVANQYFTVTQSGPVNVTLRFTNYLIYAVTIAVNGSSIGIVNASSSGSFTIPAPEALGVSFELSRPTVGGVPIGDPMVGYWNIINNPTGTYSFTIDNQISSQTYFAPIVTNTGGMALLMDVNFGLPTENRCKCVIPAGASNVEIGYYKLVNNSTVDAFRATSNYTGPYFYFDNLSSFVQEQTGVIHLTFSQAP
jgi:hypothetical protein